MAGCYKRSGCNLKGILCVLCSGGNSATERHLGVGQATGGVEGGQQSVSQLSGHVQQLVAVPRHPLATLSQQVGHHVGTQEPPGVQRESGTGGFRQVRVDNKKKKKERRFFFFFSP